MIEETVSDPPTADQFEKVCHDLMQSVATALLLSDLDGKRQVADQASRRLAAVHQQLEYAGTLLAILTDHPVTQTGYADLAEIANECVAARIADEVALRIDGVEHMVPADPVILRRAVANLLDNACRATGHSGGVTVGVGRSGAESWIEVADDGPGFGRIPPRTGHGLEIIQAAVWAGGGRLRIETGPRTGTLVRMSFPGALALAR